MARFDVPPEATSVSVSLDRVAVPMEEIADDGEGVARRFRMAHTGTLTFHRYDGENVESLHVIRYGRMAGTEVGELDYSLHSDLVEVLAKRPDLDLVALADGADELWARLDAITDGLKPEATRLVDFWHVCEYLAQAAGSVLDESEAGAKLEHWKKRLVSSPWAASTIIGELGQWNTQAAKDAKRYLENHKDRMNYADARRVGLPIGSGSVEASCKSLVALRFKRCGSRWKRDTGDAVVQLRALLLSDRWVPGMTETLKPLRRRVRSARQRRCDQRENHSPPSGRLSASIRKLPPSRSTRLISSPGRTQAERERARIEGPRSRFIRRKLSQFLPHEQQSTIAGASSPTAALRSIGLLAFEHNFEPLRQRWPLRLATMVTTARR